MFWTVLKFKKQGGKTLPQVLFTDPSWFFWAMDNIEYKNPRLFDEAQELNRKAHSIRIPQRDNEDLVAEYVFHKPTGKFGELRIVPRR